jgi:hypothetical protein
MDKVAPWISGTEMVRFNAFFDLRDVEDWVSRAKKNAANLPKDLSHEFAPLAADAVEVLQDNFVKHMRRVGITPRSGRMERETKVTKIEERKTPNGVEWHITVEGPDYASYLETGAVIRPKPGRKYLRIPFRGKESDEPVGGVMGPGAIDQGPNAYERTGVQIARARTFTLFKGKGGVRLKHPIFMMKEMASNNSKDEHRRYWNLILRDQGFSKAQKAAARRWLRENKAKLADTPETAERMIPLFALAPEITIPAKGWMTSAIQDYQLAISDVLADISTQYSRDEGFSFEISQIETNKAF